MLNSEGASAEERDRANREAQLAGLKCVRSLLAEGEVFNEAEEQNIDGKLHDTIQAALRAANNRADKTLIKITKRASLASSGSTSQTTRRGPSSPPSTRVWASIICRCTGW